LPQGGFLMVSLVGFEFLICLFVFWYYCCYWVFVWICVACLHSHLYSHFHTVHCLLLEFNWQNHPFIFQNLPLHSPHVNRPSPPPPLPPPPQLLPLSATFPAIFTICL
jgi:hypothetical protein